jgi:hypothetical protein
MKGGQKMNKNLVLTSLVLAVMLLGFASATECSTTTYVSGIIYQGAIENRVSGADVTVTCNGVTMETVSNNQGNYNTAFGCGCSVESQVTVNAVKDGQTGSNNGTVDQFSSTVNFAVVPVSMVPEFGVFAAGLTLLSAVGIFFFVRRK